MRHKKSLGQHFLSDRSFLDAIMQYVIAKQPQRIFEIGAGTGVLTKQLLLLDYEYLKVLEIDERCLDVLHGISTTRTHNTEIIHGDILKQPMPFSKPFWVLGNFPYHLSSSILFRLLEWKQYVIGIVAMFQKDVAERICSSHGSKTYGILSVMMQTYYDVTYLFDVPPDAFSPRPKVMSGVVAFVAKTKPPQLEYKKLLMLVKQAFGKRRKMLRNSVGNILRSLPNDSPILFSRPEQISVMEFHKLLKYLV